MKFKYLNVHNQENIRLIITYGDKEISFTVKDIIQKKTKANKEKLTSDKQFNVLEKYLEYKGKRFNDRLFKYLQESADKIVDSIAEVDQSSSMDSMKKILYMFDIADIEHFLKDVYGIIPPSGLLDQFKDSALSDGFGSRVQTYLKSDYFGIAALTIPAKVILGPLGEYAMLNKDNLMSDIKEYSLINLIYDADNIFLSPPAKKLYGLLEMFYNKNTSNRASLLLDKMIPSSEMPLWLFSVAFLKKLTVTNIIDDNTAKNIITECYNTANGLLNNASSTKKMIYDKKPMSDGEETESLLETYRMATDLSLGTIEEFNWVLDRPYDVLNEMGLSEFDVILKDALEFTKPLRSSTINEAVVIITSWILHDVLDSRCFWYVDSDRIVTAISLAFTYLWVNDHKRLALLLTILEIDDDLHRLSQKVNRTRIPKENIEKLKLNYSLDRIINGKRGEVRKSPVETSINLVSDEFYKNQYVYTATRDYLDNISKTVEIPYDLKPMISHAILTLDL